LIEMYACEDARTVCMYVRHERTEDALRSGVDVPLSGIKPYTDTPWLSGSTLEQFLMRIMISQYCEYRLDPPRGPPMPLPSEQTPLSRDRSGGINAPDTLRAAAHMLSGRKDLKHANALAGLLQNRADDMEHNIAIWRCTKQDVPALIEKHYGIYLTAATAVLLHPRYNLTCTAPHQTNWNLRQSGGTPSPDC
jgi:hypothetical protein